MSFALFRRYFPTLPDDPSESPLSDEERRVYRVWEMMGVLPVFVIIPLLTFAWYRTLNGAVGLFHQEVPRTRFVVQPNPLWWFGPALLLGIISAVIPVFGLYRVLLRERFRRFQRFCNEHVGFAADRVLKLLATIIIAGSAVFFVVAVRSFARFTEAGVEFGRPLSFRGSFYKYTRVQAIEHRATFRAPIGNSVQRPHYVILFDDGASWSSEDFLGATHDEAYRIAQLVSVRSGRAIAERP